MRLRLLIILVLFTIAFRMTAIVPVRPTIFNEGQRGLLFTASASAASVPTAQKLFPAIDAKSLSSSSVIDWEKLLNEIKEMLGSFGEEAIEIARHYYHVNPYCSTPAQARFSTAIAQEEAEFSEKRLLVVKAALEKLLGTTLTSDEVPRIAIAGSGGGYRAMLNTLGSLLGFEEAGLLDCTLFVSGVSGSTWCIAPWMQGRQSLQDLKEYFLEQIQTSFLTTNLDFDAIFSGLAKKWVFNEPVSLVDIYGMLLGQKLLTFLDPTAPRNLACQAQHIIDGALPMPIYASVFHTSTYQWLECTPYEIGSTFLESFIPSWAFGRLFQGGESTSFSGGFAPCASVEYFMGLCSSVFATLLWEAVKDEYHRIEKALVAHIGNWNYQVPGTPLQDEQFLKLADAGIFINYDLNSLLRRNADIIIILDASADLQDISKLQFAESYWKNLYKLPPFNYTDITKNICTVFKDAQDPSTPTIIYMPQVKNPNSSFDPQACISNGCGTFCLSYTQELAGELIGSAEQNVWDSVVLIRDAIKDKIASKQAKSLH